MEDRIKFFEEITNILEKRFVKTEKVARILSLAFAGQKFVILFGPGGHAKSEMVKELQENAQLLGYNPDDFFFQFFGEGMDEAKLYGNIDFAKMNDTAKPCIEYNPKDSFLNYKVAVFEELFDAPAAVLLSLKDTLTAKEMRNGSQRFKMKTEVIICLTNKEPEEVSELGPSAHALTERFPLQLNVKWDSYEAQDYLEMFKKVSQFIGGPILNGFKDTLAQMVAKATSEGNFVSPRTAMHAYQVCQAAAILRGGDHVQIEDLEDLVYVDGLSGYGDQLKNDLQSAMKAAEAAKSLESIANRFQVLSAEVADSATPIKALQVAKRLSELVDELSRLAVPNEQADTRKSLMANVTEMKTRAINKSLEVTRI